MAAKLPAETEDRSSFGRLRRTLGDVGRSIGNRLSLLKGPIPADAHTPPMRLFFAELGAIAEPVLRRLRPDLSIEPSAKPRVVILLPGFATGPSRMQYMARQLERAGHTVKRWGLGHNMGPTDDTLDELAKRVRAVSQRYGQKVVLVGWSLGGLFAREVAKRHPECVAKVVTLGSPFSHTPYSNNIWRTYQVVAGHTVDAPPIAGPLSAKPPVETVAIWSPRDGVVSWRAACGTAEERDRTIALRCTHLTFPNAPDSIRAVLRELEG